MSQRDQFWGGSIIRVKAGTLRAKAGTRAVFIAGLLATSVFVGAQTKPGMPDAQIEANVLKALASAPQLADQTISTTTVYGVVTLSGTVRDEASRKMAETLVSNAKGVQKVVDELTLGDSTQADVARDEGVPAGAETNPRQDESMSQTTQAPSPAQEPTQEMPPSQTQQPAPAPQQQASPEERSVDRSQSGTTPLPPPYRRPYGQPYPPRTYPPQAYPPQNSSPQSPYGQQQAYGEQVYGGQRGGDAVIVPSGSLLRVRVSQGLASNHTQPGATFDGVVVNDVVSGGAVAIPRGAAVTGRVVDAETSGTLKGRGELSLQLTAVSLAGRNYPITSDVWSRHGADKTLTSVNSAVGLGAVGAIIGGVAGGGAGAAIGAGVGGVAGLGASAASGRNGAAIPPEAILTFHLQQPAELTTVSQAEMDRLGYGVPPGMQPQMRRRYPPPPPPGYYSPYAPVYYPPYYYRYPY